MVKVDVVTAPPGPHRQLRSRAVILWQQSTDAQQVLAVNSLIIILYITFSHRFLVLSFSVLYTVLEYC